MGSNSNIIPLTGKVFGFLTVLRREGALPAHKSQKAKPTWRCRCTCGKEVVVRGDHLRRSVKKSCSLDGHYFRFEMVDATIEERRIYNGMLQRCYNPKNQPSFNRYGARGVRVHRTWKNSFNQFLSDVGPRPSPKHSLDRFPKRHGNYEPGNVRWATKREQTINRDETVRVNFNGEVITIADYAKKIGVNARMIQKRLQNGWTVEEALTLPSRGRSKNQYPKDWIDGTAFIKRAVDKDTTM